MAEQSFRSRPTIGFLTRGVSGAPMWRGVADVAKERDVNLIVVAGGMLDSPHGFEAQSNVLYDLIQTTGIDGFVVASGILGHYGGVEKMQAFCARYRNVPVVSVEVPLSGIPSVLLDFYHGMQAILEHLIVAHGYRRIAFIRGPEESKTGEDRYRAYRDALSEHSLPFDPNLVTSGTFFAPSGEEAARLLLDERHARFEAIAAANDYMALDVMRALQARGIRVPEDIAVVGFDDREESRVATPPLTTAQLRQYDQGRQGAEALLALLNGQPVPEQMTLPATLVVRQSCGCASRTVEHAAAGILAMPDASRVLELSAAQERMCADLAQKEETAAIAPEWMTTLSESAAAEIRGEASGVFLAALKEMLRKTTLNGERAAAWSDALSFLRRDMRACLRSQAEVLCAEDLWQQARTLIGEFAERWQVLQRMQAERQFLTVRELGQALITTFNMPDLMNILARELPRAGIPGCYLSLYESPAEASSSSDRQTVCARLMLAYHAGGRVALPSDGQRFPSAQLVPTGILPDHQRQTLLLEALYFREDQLGFVLFEVGTEDIVTRMTQMVETSSENPLRVEISSALQGALLVERVQVHAAEIVRQKYILDTFMANVPDAIYFKDHASRIIQANQAHAERLGCGEPVNEIGKTDFDFFPNNLAQRRYDQEQAILRTGEPLLNEEEYDTQGRWMLTTKMPLRDEHGAIIGTFGISRDITALKQAEQELRQYRDHLEQLVSQRTTELSRSNTLLHAEVLERQRAEQALRVEEQQYRLLAENVQDGIAIVQAQRVVFVNHGIARMLNRPVEQLIQADPAHIFQVAEPARFHAWQEQARDGGVIPSWQAELSLSDGRIVWAELEITAIAWNGQPAVLLTIRDITGRKLREQRLEEERARLEQENITLKFSIKERYRFGNLVGKSPAMQRVYELIVNAASSEANVLVIGESGTGKELIAQTLHQVSRRKARAFVPVNCASIPETLFEREFFGHRKGAFTGADRDAPGLFDKAHQGTLFLDEVTELSPASQAKLLRVLQDGIYTPLGSAAPKQADVLIVAATNKDCRQEIAQGRLRKDFFYRIGVIELHVPPLRERKEDLPLLLECIFEQYHRKQAAIHGRAGLAAPADPNMLPPELMHALYACAWPGNVRELQNVLQRYLATRDLAAVLASLGVTSRAVPTLTPEELSSEHSLPEAVALLEKRLIAETLARTGHHIGKTSALLNVPRRTLQRKIKAYDL